MRGCFEFFLLMFSLLLRYVARNFSFSSVKICNLILIYVEWIKTLLFLVRATFVVQNLKVAVGFFLLLGIGSKLASVKSLKADVSSVSPSTIALAKGYRSERQLLNSLRWSIYVINSVDNAKLTFHYLFSYVVHQFAFRVRVLVWSFTLMLVKETNNVGFTSAVVASVKTRKY